MMQFYYDEDVILMLCVDKFECILYRYCRYCIGTTTFGCFQTNEGYGDRIYHHSRPSWMINSTDAFVNYRERRRASEKRIVEGGQRSTV